MNRMIVLVLVAWLAGSAGAQGLTVWTPWTGRSLEVLREDVAAFERAFEIPAVVRSLDAVELERRLLAAAEDGAGDAADVLVGVSHDRAAQLAAAGVVADLGGHATSTYLADLSGQARLAFTVDGRLVGLPMFVEGPALLYNRALLERLPEHYDAFLAAAAEHTDEDRYGFLFDIENFYFNYAWLGTFGGYVFGRDDDGRLRTDDVGLATDGAIAGANALRALRHELGLIPPGMDYERAHRAFLRGRAASIYSGPWAVRAAREAGIDVAVAPVPPLPDGTAWSGFMQVEGVLVAEQAPRRTAAVNLAKWLSRADAQLLYARRDGRVPSSQEALDRVADPAVAGFGRAMLASEPIPDASAMGRVWGAMDDAVRQLLSADPGDARAVMEAAVRTVLGR